MGFPEAVSTGFQQFFSASGRSSRSQYWYWFLFNILVGIGAVVIEGAIVASDAGRLTALFVSLINLFLLLMGISTICAGIRRLHDSGRSGANILFGLIPAIGGIILIVLFCSSSDPYINEYGEPEVYSEDYY